jgi:hypothetical protein
MKKIGFLVIIFVYVTFAYAGDEIVCRVDGNARLAYSVQISGSIGYAGTKGQVLDGTILSLDPMEEGGALNGVAVPSTITVTEGLAGTRTGGITFIDILGQGGLELNLSGELNNNVPFPFYGTVNLSPQQTLHCSYYPGSGSPGLLNIHNLKANEQFMGQSANTDERWCGPPRLRYPCCEDTNSCKDE